MKRARAEAYRRQFTRRFRRGTFGRESQPAIERIKQAVSETRVAARHDPVLAAEGTVSFLERVSPADARTRERWRRASGRPTSGMRSPASRPWATSGAIVRIARGGHGHEITGADVWAAHASTMKAAERAGRVAEVQAQVREIVAGEPPGDRFVTRMLGRELGL